MHWIGNWDSLILSNAPSAILVITLNIKPVYKNIIKINKKKLYEMQLFHLVIEVHSYFLRIFLIIPCSESFEFSFSSGINHLQP